MGPSHVKNMMSAVAALQTQESFQLTAQHSMMGRRSPPRGGVDPGAANQQMLVSSDEDAEQEPGANALVPSSDDKILRKAKKAQKTSKKRLRLEEAEAFLRAKGIDPHAVASLQDSPRKQKHKSKHKSVKL